MSEPSPVVLRLPEPGSDEPVRPGRSVSASRRPPAARTLLLLPAGLALLAGLDAALMLLGLPAPVRVDRLPQVHGLLLVLGFVGSLVALERAVALGRSWGYTAPGGLAAGGALLIAPVPLPIAGWALLVGAAALVAVHVPLWRRSPTGAVLVQAGGAVLSVGAALLWLGGVPVPWLLPWLAGFLVLTILGERLELARVGLLPSHAEPVAVVLAGLVGIGTLAALLWAPVGYPLLGAAVLGLAGWLLRYDVARHTIRSSGLPRFMAACLLAGYGWLAVASGIWLLRGPVFGGFGYDAVVHAVFLGFVLSMVMAHAPVVLSAVTRRPLPYRPVMFLPAALLHASLLLRIGVGDVRGIHWAGQVGGLLAIVALLIFVVLAVWSTLRRPPAPTRVPITEAPGTAA